MNSDLCMAFIRIEPKYRNQFIRLVSIVKEEIVVTYVPDVGVIGILLQLTHVSVLDRLTNFGLQLCGH